MNIFKVNKIIDRLAIMIENAMHGEVIENTFDETKMSALETKLSRYISINEAKRRKLEVEKLQINELVSDISHQTKTPLANILLCSELLKESDLSDQNRHCVKVLLAQTEKLNFLIASLVKTSRLETGIISIIPNLQSVQLLLDNVLEQINGSSLNKNIKIIADKTDIKAIFDFKWTVEAIYNILDNAVKYTGVGGKITISVTAYQFFCRIDICDTGIGIRDKEISKIFSRFYRSTDVSDIDGVGLGLYLARQIISDDGGYIKVKSKVGLGSTFSIFLPLEN